MKTHNAKPGVFVALVHETLKQGTFASRPDLSEAVKERAARLKFAYDSALVGDAIDQVERVRGPLFAASTTALPPEEPVNEPPLSREEAASFLGELRQRLRLNARPKRMPYAAPVRRVDLARTKALQFALDEVQAAKARCDALDAATVRELEEVKR